MWRQYTEPNRNRFIKGIVITPGIFLMIFIANHLERHSIIGRIGWSAIANLIITLIAMLIIFSFTNYKLQESHNS